MSNHEVLGGFELRVLLATLHLREEAYTTTLVNELEDRTGREVAPAAVYIAWRRLEKRGLVESELRKETHEGGRRSRRYFSVTDEGLTVAAAARRELTRLWDGLELNPSRE